MCNKRLRQRFGATLLLRSNQGVPAVLHGVVGAAWKLLCDLGPLVANLRLHAEDDAIFFLAPPALLDVGLQVVVVALAALLSRASAELGGDGAPIAGSAGVHKR